jgi:hypothetical protein
MKRSHLAVVALLIGVGVALGTFAVTRTSQLGASSRASSKKTVDVTVSAQSRRLNALEASLRKALATKPPALPPIPKLEPAPQATTRVTYSAAPAPATRIVVRSAAASFAAPSASHGEQNRHSGSGGEQDD